MKRHVDTDPDQTTSDDKKLKRIKSSDSVPATSSSSASAVLSDENLLYEVLKHADARALGLAACVSKQWRVTARDERLWEMQCTRHCASVNERQFRSVVLALGGFRNLHALYLWPLTKPSPGSTAVASPPSSAAWPCIPAAPAGRSGKAARWGKDEVHLSLSLLSIRYYEKMNFSNMGKGL